MLASLQLKYSYEKRHSACAEDIQPHPQVLYCIHSQGYLQTLEFFLAALEDRARQRRQNLAAPGYCEKGFCYILAAQPLPYVFVQFHHSSLGWSSRAVQCVA
ncbi:hypothetical protein D3C73_1112570 [compost metagenome]